jgi:hypothetical protein
MFKYVTRRVRDTIQLGLNVRKSFQCVPNQQQNDNNKNDPKLNYTVVPRYQDPSRDKDKSDEKFKKKYSRLHNNHCFLNALTWVNFLGLEMLFRSLFLIISSYFPNRALLSSQAFILHNFFVFTVETND